MAKLQFIFIFTTCLHSVTSAQWSAPTILNYFNDINVYIIEALVCSNQDAMDLFKPIATFSGGGNREYTMLFRIINTFDSMAASDTRTGIFVDLSCARNQKLLADIESDNYFKSNIFWFIWDQERTLSSSKSSLPLSTYSNVVLADFGGLQQIRKIWRDHPVENISRGQYDNQTGNYVLYPLASKIDMKGSAVQAAIADVYDDKDNLVLQLQDVDHFPGFDMMNKFYYNNFLLLEYLYNFKLELIITDDWGTRADDGTWSGMLGLIQRGEVYLTSTPMVAISNRLEVATPMFPLVPYW